MKILIVLYYYTPYVSGLSMLAKMQAEGLAARGHHVTVLTMQYRSDLATEEVHNGVHIVRAKVLAKVSKGVVSLDFLEKIVSLSRLHDIVNPHLPNAHFGLVLPFINAKKLIPQYHCDLELGGGLVNQFLQKVSYWSMGKTLEKASRIIATTSDYFSSCHFARFAKRVFEIYPPIDDKKFGRCDPSGLKTRLRIEGHPYMVGFVGRIVAEKGLEYLLQAIPLLSKKIDDFIILIAGEYEQVAGGSVKEQVDSLAKEFPGRVKFVGHLKFNDLVTFYNLIDVLVLPSVDPLEAFGMVQVEAMLCGTPVIATDMPGVREVIRKTGCGALIQKRSPQDIADKIASLYGNPVIVRREGLVEFEYERSIDRYETIFSSML